DVSDHCVRYHDYLLFRSFERTGTLRFGAHGLDSVHGFLRLVYERVTQVTGPAQVFVHLSNDIRESSDGLDVIIPGLGIELGDIVGVLYESCCLDNFQRIGGRWQQTGNQWVRVECNWGHQFLEVSRAPSRR